MASKKLGRSYHRNFHRARKFHSNLPEFPNEPNGKMASSMSKTYGRFEVVRPVSFDVGYQYLGSQVTKITKKYQKDEDIEVLRSPMVPVVTAGRFETIQKTAEEFGVDFSPIDVLASARTRPLLLFGEVTDVVTLPSAPHSAHDYRVALELDVGTKQNLQDDAEELLAFCDLSGVNIGLNNHRNPTVNVAKSNDLGHMYSIRSKIEELGVQNAGIVLGRISMRSLR